MGLVILVVVLMVAITIVNSSFVSASNIMNVLKGNVILAIVAVGMLMVMITGRVSIPLSAE